MAVTNMYLFKQIGHNPAKFADPLPGSFQLTTKGVHKGDCFFSAAPFYPACFLTCKNSCKISFRPDKTLWPGY